MQLKKIYKILKGNETKGSEADVFIKAIAGMNHLLNSHVDLKIKGIMPDTAGEDGLRRWGQILGLGRKEKEDISSFRRRILNRIRMPPHGGCRNDFEAKILDKFSNVKLAYCFPTTKPGESAPQAGHVTIAAVNEQYEVIKGEASNNIREFSEREAPLSIKVHYKELKVKDIYFEIFTYSKTPQIQKWRKKCESALDVFFKGHMPGGLTDHWEVSLAGIHQVLNRVGPYNYRINIPSENISLGFFELPRLKKGGIKWIPS